LTERRSTEREQRDYESHKELLEGSNPEYLAEAPFLLMNRILAQMNKIILANVRKEYAFSAVASDVDDSVHPKRVLTVAAGRVVGILV